MLESNATDEDCVRTLQGAEEVTRVQEDPLSILLQTSFNNPMYYGQDVIDDSPSFRSPLLILSSMKG